MLPSQTGEATDQTEPIYIGSIAGGPDFAAGLTRQQLSITVFRRSMIASRLALIGLVLIAAVYFSVNGKTAWPLLGFGVFTLLLVVPWVLVYVLVLRNARRMFPEGSTYVVELRQSTLTIRAPHKATQTAYAVFDRLQRFNDFVVLRERITRHNAMIPRAALSDDAFEFLVAHIQPQKAAKPDE